jgi:putative transposase
LHEEFKRRIKTQTVLPSADTAAMLFWALLASGQISMRKIDGWHTLATKLIDQAIDLAACSRPSKKGGYSDIAPLSKTHQPAS